MRIQITGSREFTDIKKLAGAIAGAVFSIYGSDHTIVHGGAKGADSLAGEVARNWGYTEEVHPADWEKYGKRAGYLRNAEMANLGADVCLAFFKRGAGNRGTQMMVDLCNKAGIPVKEYWED